MKLLADENIEASVVAWLRETGHDVCWAAEVLVSTADETLLEIACREQRILLSYDLDFGELVYLERRPAAGIILLRFKSSNKWERLALLQRWWPRIEEMAIGHFIVVRNNRIRVRNLLAE
jgi:predicted nuclease of predicted toxin-antitoxin system